MDKNRLITLELSLTKGNGVKVFQQLWEKYQDIDLICQSTEVESLLTAETALLANEIASDYNYLCCWEDDFPYLLKQIPDCPLILYYLGDKNLLAKSAVAVVGSRQPTLYGKTMTKQFATRLTQVGLVVVSGMAYGIDTLAHSAAIESSSSSTIAVLASAVDDPTPPRNLAIYKTIIESGGLILSATHPGTKLDKWMFVGRNRIIAGLSKATLVVEAAVDSGALTTASLAFDYDREVFAIPGNIDTALSVGTNGLIKQNKAKLVQNVEDILIDLNFVLPGQATLSISKREPQLDKAITPELELILSCIRNGYDSIDLINNALPQLESSAILSRLASLEISGMLIKQTDGKYKAII